MNRMARASVVLVAFAAGAQGAMAAMISDSVPTPSRQSADPFGLPGSGLSSDYFGVTEYTDNPDPTPDTYAIDGTPTNFGNDLQNWDTAPVQGGPVALFGRDIDHINPDGGGNQNFSGETATWSVEVPAGVVVTSVDFTAQAVIRRGPNPNVVYEDTDTLSYALTAPGSALDSTSVVLVAGDVDRLAPDGVSLGDNSYAFPESALFADAGLGFVTAAPTTYEVVLTVNDFEAGAEGFWTSGVLTVEYAIPEPTGAALGVVSMLAAAVARRRN